MQTNNEREQDDIEALIREMQGQQAQPAQPMQQAQPMQEPSAGDDIDALIQSAQGQAQKPGAEIPPAPLADKVDEPKFFKKTLEDLNKMKTSMGMDQQDDGSVFNYFEPVGRGALGMIATSINGLYSGAQVLFPGDSVEKDIMQFNKRQEWINKNIIEPKTKEGKIAQAGLEWLGQKAMIPVSGYAGLVELLMTQDLDKATQSIEQLQSGQKSFGDVLGDANYAATGDPVWAAAVKTATDGLPALIGARFAQKPLVDRRIQAEVGKLQEQMQAQMLQQQQTGQLREVTGAQMADRQLMLLDQISNERQRIDYEEMRMIEAEMRENPKYAREIVKSISNRPDPAAAEVIKQGASKGAVANMKATTPETRKIMRKMLGNANEVLNDEGLAASLRPSMAMGDIVNRRINFLNNKRKQVGNDINQAVKRFDNEVIPLEDSAPIANRFVENLRELGVELNDRTLEPLFDNSSVRDVPAFRKVIIDAMQDLSTKEMTPRQLHFFKKRLDENISYGQKQEGLSAGVEIALQSLRGDINDYLGRINPEYRQANQDYAELKMALDNSENAFKIKKKLQLNPALQEAYDTQKIGQELRKTLSNYAAGIDIRQTLQNIEDVTGKYGLNDNVQVARLISFDNQLNSMMPSLIPGAFKSQVAQGIDSARIVAEPKQAILGKVFKFADDVYDDMRGVNETNASRAIQRMLDELDASVKRRPGTNITTTDRNPGDE